MKNIQSKPAALFPVALLVLSTIIYQPSTLCAQGTAFTYQGVLNANGNPVTGLYDFNFNLFTNSSLGIPVAAEWTSLAVGVTNGLFMTVIDFGGGVFTGARYWLEVGSRPNASSAAFQIMTPRQELTPTPYSIFAENASGGGASDGWALGGNGGTTAANFVGTTDPQPLELRVNNARALRLELNGSGAPNVIGGAAVNFVAALHVGATIAGGGAANYNGGAYPNSVIGDFGTVGGGEYNVSGTNATVGGGAGNGAANLFATVGGGEGNLALGEDSTVAGGVVNEASGLHSTVAGGYNNAASQVAATIAGGSDNIASGNNATVGGGGGNGATNSCATVGGGGGNQAQGQNSTVAGGYNNIASSQSSTVSGGEDNIAGYANVTISGGARNSASSADAVIAGGNDNTNSGPGSVIGGGYQNQIRSSSLSHAEGSVIGGGSRNEVTGEFAVIPGGDGNTASGYVSFAAGQNAHADHDRSFVWGDGSGSAHSTDAASFMVYARGGSATYNGGGSWSFSSDRNLKTNITPVDERSILDRVSHLPISQWNMKGQDLSQQHIGPMAQDFHEAFGLNGSDDTHINGADESGVALAAIQGLNQKVEEKEARIRELEARLEKLEQLIRR